MKVILSLALVIGLLGAATADAAQTPAMQVYLEDNGSGGMIVGASAAPPVAETWSWQACAPDGLECVPFASGEKVGTANARANTVFVVTPSGAPSQRSPIWHGNVAAGTPPSVSGQVRANTLVTPVDATWTGGWTGDRDHTEMAECRYANGTGCRAITGLGGPACAREAAVLDPAYTGRYLRIADQIYASDIPLEEGDPNSLTFLGFVWPSEPTTAVAVVGRIAPATAPRTARCGPAPLALGSEPSATLSKQGVATIRCPAACSIVLRADRGALHVQRTRALPVWGTVTLRLSPSALERLRPGPSVFSVEIDGAVATMRTVAVA